MQQSKYNLTKILKYVKANDVFKRNYWHLAFVISFDITYVIPYR